MSTHKLNLERLGHAGYVDLSDCYRIVAGMVPEAPEPELDLSDGARLKWSAAGVELTIGQHSGGFGGAWAHEGRDWRYVAELHGHAEIAAALRGLCEGAEG